jgi:hypothetical protein
VNSEDIVRGYLAMPICSKCGLGFNLSSALSQKRW